MSKFFVSKSGLIAIRLDAIRSVAANEKEEGEGATVVFMDDSDPIYLFSVQDVADLMHELRNLT